MKTILLFDARFRDRAPQRLRVADEIASAAVRSGVAAAADPSEHAGLVAGGALDGGDLTEVVLETGSGRLVRAVLPLSVVIIGAQAGKMASIGRAVGGVVAPTPTPPQSGTMFRQPAPGEPYLGFVLGASRRAQGDQAIDTENYDRMSSNTNGDLNHARAMHTGVDYVVFADRTEHTGYSQHGMCFANDGESVSDMEARIPAIIDSDAHWGLVDFSIGTQFLALPVAEYCLRVQSAITRMRAAGIDAWWYEIYERGEADGTDWVRGGIGPTKVLQVVQIMEQWCAQQTPAVPIWRTRATLINGANDNQPFPFAYRSAGVDETHPAPIGAFRVALANLPALKARYPELAVNVARAANKVINAQMAGSVAIATANGASGTVPTSYAGSGGAGNTSAGEFSVVEVDGVRRTQCVVDRSAMMAGVADTYTLGIPLAGLANGTWLRTRVREGFGGGSGLRSQFTTLRDNLSQENLTRGHTSVTTQGASDTGGAALFQDTAAYGIAAPYRANAHPVLFPNLANATFSATVSIDKGDGSPLTIWWSEPEVWEYGDPHRLMFNEAIPGPAQITSAATWSVLENTTGQIQLTANVGGKWSIAGQDVARFGQPSVNGLIVFAAKDFEDPTDDATGLNNSYVTTVTFTPRNPAIAPVTQLLTVNVIDDADGFSDPMGAAYAANTPLETNPAWTLDAGAAAGGIQYTGTSIKLASSAVSGATAPQQGNTVEQDISFVCRVAATAAGYAAVLKLDGATWLGITGWSSTSVTVRNGGASFATFTPFQPVVINDRLRLRIINRAGVYRLECRQNGKILQLATGTDDVTALVTGASALAAARKSGVGTRTSTNPAWIKAWNNRVVAGELADAVAFRPITWGAGDTSRNVVGTSTIQKIAGFTQGSNVGAIITAQPAGSVAQIKPDGDQVRLTDLIPGTYTIRITELDPGTLGAINSGRTSDLTLIVTGA